MSSPFISWVMNYHDKWVDYERAMIQSFISCLCAVWLGWVGWDYGSMMHNTMFWGLLLGHQQINVPLPPGDIWLTMIIPGAGLKQFTALNTRSYSWQEGSLFITNHFEYFTLLNNPDLNSWFRQFCTPEFQTLSVPLLLVLMVFWWKISAMVAIRSSLFLMSGR